MCGEIFKVNQMFISLRKSMGGGGEKKEEEKRRHSKQ